MTRKTLEELAAAYGLGALDQAEATQLEALMAQDADARQEVAAFMGIRFLSPTSQLSETAISKDKIRPLACAS